MRFLVWSVSPHFYHMASIDAPQAYPPPRNFVRLLLTLTEDQETLQQFPSQIWLLHPHRRGPRLV